MKTYPTTFIITWETLRFVSNVNWYTNQMEKLYQITFSSLVANKVKLAQLKAKCDVIVWYCRVENCDGS